MFQVRILERVMSPDGRVRVALSATQVHPDAGNLALMEDDESYARVLVARLLACASRENRILERLGFEALYDYGTAIPFIHGPVVSERETISLVDVLGMPEPRRSEVARDFRLDIWDLQESPPSEAWHGNWRDRSRIVCVVDADWIEHLHVGAAFDAY